MAQQQLQEELDRINNRYADFTPRAAFAKYVAKHPEEHHAYLWDLLKMLRKHSLKSIYILFCEV